MKNKSEQLNIYFRLLGKSYFRLFMEFPVVLKLLFILLFTGGIYLLNEFPFAPSLTNLFIIYVLFVIMGQRICMMSSSERTLLKLLDVSIVGIRVIKCVLLSVLFFILNFYAGLVAISLGTLSLLFYPERVTKNIQIPSFYIKSSYQWISMYRRMGIWILIGGLLFLTIGLWHQNRNMVCVFLGLINILPCFLAYYEREDTVPFLAVYKSSSYLLQTKLYELLYNIIIPLIFSLLLLVIIDYSGIGFYLKYAAFFIYTDLLLFYCYYVFYPHILTSCVLFCILASVSLTLFFSYPLLFIIVVFVLLFVLHLVAVINLKPFCAHGKF